MTVFAVQKNQSEDLLISWPRAPNELLPNHPSASLPELGLCSSIRASDNKNSAIYLNFQNIFRNIALPKPLSRLFLLQIVLISDLHDAICGDVAKMLKISSTSPHPLASLSGHHAPEVRMICICWANHLTSMHVGSFSNFPGIQTKS